MRGVKIFGVIAGLVFAGMGLTVANLALNRGKVVPGLDLNQPRHPVTPEMAEQVKKLNLKTAKLFKLPNSEGKLTLVGGAGPKPQFIYAVKKGCPCSFDAEPLMHALYKQFGGRIEFVSVTDAKKEDAHLWEMQLRVPYSVVPSPDLAVMQEYQYPASVYCSLVDTRGVIVKRWAGYSKSYLKEMNAEMAKLLGEKEKPFDTQYAPEAQTSGCSYEGYKGEFVIPADDNA